ncbi:SRPBCC family protein [Streptomyces sp. NPDC006368]|uniref:SRPBCC family protein n=1 Tax=Streptomyces sp. NPDC006368 TaxID=3156760 RepID=UPI0033ACF9CD
MRKNLKGADMSSIKESIEISRRPEDVFAYLADPVHLAEWQESAVAVRPVGDRPAGVGARVVVTRRVGRRQFPMTMEMSELDPPRSFRLDGVDGPVRGHVRGMVEPVGDGDRSRVTLDLDFEAHGVGKALVPLVVRPQARKEMARNEQRLKELLERRP